MHAGAANAMPEDSVPSKVRLHKAEYHIILHLVLHSMLSLLEFRNSGEKNQNLHGVATVKSGLLG